jgi:hypothetical protein
MMMRHCRAAVRALSGAARVLFIFLWLPPPWRLVASTLLLDPGPMVRPRMHDCRDIQQGADMTQRIPENFSTVDWSLVTNMGNTIPPRDPNDDEDEDSDTEPDDEREPAVVREPDEDE